MSNFPSLLEESSSSVAEALSALGLTNLPSLEIRVGYFGTGNRLHVFIGCWDLRGGEGVWMKACEGFSFSGWGKPFMFGNESMEKSHQSEARANCWRCAKALGVIDRYPGIEERRRIEREGGPFVSHQEKQGSK